MKVNTSPALVLCAVVLFGGASMAVAQVDGPEPPDGPMQGLLHRERLADRLLGEFDANHDGKITHAEFNSILGGRFAAATHGAKLMSADQFLAIHQADFAKHSLEMFRRVDWNGDGKLTPEEFSAPQRAHFEMMDRDGSGTVSCSPADSRTGGPRTPGSYSSARGGRGSGGFGRARFCSNADLSRDGRVTRAEFTTIIAKEFSAATGGAATMTLQQFTASEAARYRDTNAKMFKRLDTQGNSQLTLAEFAAPSEKLFDRLDRNHDGVITSDEMKPRFHGRDRADYYSKTADRSRRPSTDRRN